MQLSFPLVLGLTWQDNAVLVLYLAGMIVWGSGSRVERGVTRITF